MPSEALCDSPLNVISVEESYACYIGTFVGASAVHHCVGCDGRAVRECLANGTWDGTIPQCDCKHIKLGLRHSNICDLYSDDYLASTACRIQKKNNYNDVTVR